MAAGITDHAWSIAECCTPDLYIGMAEQFSNNISTQIQVAMDAVTTTVSVESVAGFPVTPQFRIMIQKELMPRSVFQH